VRPAFSGEDSIVTVTERYLGEDPNGGILLHRVTAASRAMSGLMTHLLEARLRSPRLDGDASEERIEIVLV
jgi:hypothetical protein